MSDIEPGGMWRPRIYRSENDVAYEYARHCKWRPGSLNRRQGDTLPFSLALFSFFLFSFALLCLPVLRFFFFT